jgi:predicted small metal-binding protein
MKSLSCRDAGFDCDHVMQGENDDDLFRKGQSHAFNTHGMKKQEFTPAFNEKMRQLIRDT